MKPGMLLLVFFAFVAFAIWWEVGLWQECRADHSWFYCVRVLQHP